MNPTKATHAEWFYSSVFRALTIGMAACLLVASATPTDAKTLRELLVEVGYRPVKMKRVDNFWYVDVKLNGRTRRAIVDTGCSESVVDKVIAAKFPRVGTVEVAGIRPVKREVVRIEKLELEGTVFTNVTAGVAELREPWEGRVPTGSHIELSSSHDAIVGKGFLERSHGVLHVATSTLYLRLDTPTARQTNVLAKTLTASGLTNVPLADVGPHAWGVTANINGHAATLLLDTGTSATTIDSTTAAAWGITGDHTRIESFGVDNRKSTGMIGRIKVLEISGCRLLNYPVDVGDLSP